MKTLFLLLFGMTLAGCHGHDSSVQKNAVADMSLPVIAGDLSNQKINTFAEDAQGHVWIGTFRGLNKYNVHEYHQYFCNDDSLMLPDNQVNHLFRDSRERLWVATVNGAALYTDRDNFRHIPIDFPNRNGQQFLENSEGRIFLSMVTSLCVFNPDKERMECAIRDFDPGHFLCGQCYIDEADHLWDVKPYALRCYHSSTLELKDSIPTRNAPFASCLRGNGELWLAGDHSLDLLDTRTRRYMPLPEAVVRCRRLRESTVNLMYPYGDDGLLLYSNSDGLFFYDARRDTVLHQSENGFPFEAPGFRINRMFTDSQHNLWIGSVDQGYTVIYHYKERFNQNNYLHRSLEHKSVVSLDTDPEGRLWMATLTDGIYMYDTRSKELKQVRPEEGAGVSGQGKAEYNFLFVDDTGALWLSTRSHTLLKCRYATDGKLHVERQHAVFMPMSMVQDAGRTLWVSTATRYLYAMKPGEETFTLVKPFPESAGFTFIPALLPRSDGQMLVAAFKQPVRRMDVATRQVEDLPLCPDEWRECIRRSVFIPTILYEDSRQDVWIGTVGNGLMRYRPATGRLEPVPGIPCTDISSIEEDGQGNVWVSTMYGLSKYDRLSGRFTTYYAADGIGGNQFYDRASCRLPDGTLVFGGTHGLTSFQPVDVAGKRDIPLLFEDLKVHNKLMHPSQKDACIDRHLSYRPDIRLTHEQNGFSISFSALDYCEYERVHYYYRLEGFDKYWVDANNNREAYYANLPAGHYTFRVKITNNDKSIVEAENSIRIVVQPAPWRTWWAYALYVLMAGILVWLFVRARIRIRREREAARLVRLEKEQEQRVNRMNMSFFANVSHEFRTPLTMISGPISLLCERSGMQKEDRHLLRIVQRSVERMLRLVNQMMDFNKLENDTLRLKVKRMDIIVELQRFTDIFAVNAAEKGIALNTYGIEDTFVMWLDADKLDKITGNLLSNAMKFTPDGGKIELGFDVITDTEAAGLYPPAAGGTGTRYVKITVSDTGAGIPEEQQEKIFERYYQLNDRNGGSYNWGTGIGLYYARSLALLHHGYLWAGNRPEGTGAVFTLLLPVNDAAYSEEERCTDEGDQRKCFPLPSPETLCAETEEEAGTEEEAAPVRQTILVVDDDTEVVRYLKALLSASYRVVCRFDADTAFRSMGEEAPDLVLSDVVMPGRSGYELCRQIKEDSQLCHIPVVLVTAKATVENQVEGLNTGADAYVTKPFEPHYLLALINSQLKNREKVRNLLNRSTQTDKIAENVLSPQDNAFMTDLYRLMETELSNPELDVARMTERMHTSRTKFYYKVKGLTGENPGSFFRTYKLNRAAELIKEGRHTVSEIADMTGFSTLSHFSTSFKKHFGVAPSDYQGRNPA